MIGVVVIALNVIVFSGIILWVFLPRKTPKQKAGTHAGYTQVHTTSNEKKQIAEPDAYVMRLFEETYQNTLKYLEEVDYVINARFELLPFIYIVIDFIAACKADGRRDFISGSAMIVAEKYLFTNEMKIKFGKRLDLYTLIIRGTEARGDWFFGDYPKDNIILNLLVALGDILTNPSCADDYVNAPVKIVDFDKYLHFSLVMINQISQSLNYLVNEIFYV